jgi:uncharacterized protein (TIGR02271 family)
MASPVTRNTIIAVFPDAETADSVIRQLVDAGISRSRIHAGSGDRASDVARGGAGLSGTAPEHHSTGFVGWLESLFGGDDTDRERSRYTDAVGRGHCVVAVDAEDAERDRAVDIMESNGAVDVDEDRTDVRDQRSDIDTGRERASETGSATRGTSGSTRAIPVVREELQVGKRTVPRGGVRVYTRTVEEPVEEQVTLREEKVNVDRRSVDRAASSPDMAELRDQVIEVRETVEEPVVRKQARVVEEVVVGKETRQRTETIRDTVRNQHVEVEQLGAEGDAVRQDDESAAYQRDFQTRYASSGEQFASYRPAYEYGYTSASDPRYSGRNFDDVEEDLRTDYLRRNPNSTWDRVRGAVRYGWERVTGKR